jgi:hypothetical protein
LQVAASQNEASVDWEDWIDMPGRFVSARNHLDQKRQSPWRAQRRFRYDNQFVDGTETYYMTTHKRGV